MVDGASVTGSWDKTVFPFITFWDTSLDGGFTIGSQPGDQWPKPGQCLPVGARYWPGVQRSATAQSIPEPATWAMVLLGVGLMGAGLRMSARGKEGASSAA